MNLPPPVIPPALAAMAAYPQWICWQLIHKPGKPKPDKVPSDPRTRLPIDAQNPANQMTSAKAIEAAKATGLGLGFVFTERDPFYFLDIDNCATPHGPRPWSDLAYQLISQLPGAAVETSVSGRGLHVFGRCPGNFPAHGCTHKALGIELYSSKHYAALGWSAEGDANTVCPAISTVAEQYFPPAPDLDGVWTTEAQPFCGIADEDKLINKACELSIDGQYSLNQKASFQDLWLGNELVLFLAYPTSTPGEPYDRSAADIALAFHLAFWTGGNCEQVKKIMERSTLHRGKWFDRNDYLPNTIMKAVGRCRNFYQSKSQRDAQEQARIDASIAEQVATPTPPAPTPAANDTPPPSKLKDGYPYVDPVATQELFEKYTYVESVDRLVSPKGDLINQSQFKTKFRNRAFSLSLKTNKTTTNAWKVYMEAEYLNTPQADRLCFRPGDPRHIVPDGEDTLANIWRDPKPRRVKGDPTRFVRHVQRMLPNGDDAERVLAYLAACVQHQGTKFAWCPMIQGTYGNGKSLMGKVLTKVIGEKYVHELRSDSIGSQFNGWVQGHSLIRVDDVHFGGKKSTLEIVKPLITADRIAVERKGCDQVTEDVCCNFLMTTNHQDAIPLDPDERRWAVYCCAQQTKRDKIRDGLTDAYFDSMWRWLKDEDGYAIVADYLWSYVIPNEMNPAGLCTTAPVTTTHHVAVEASRSVEAQLIGDAIETGGPGFADGWVSTVAAMNMLRENRTPTTPQKIAVEIAKLGYVRHPGLVSGKPTRNVSGEGKRSRLWVKEGHPSWHLQGEDVVKAYEKAQGYAVAGNVVPLRT